ncbi:hypothetical protein GCM10029964_034040 [Kibdelosporangium lantanae]
MVTEPIDEHFTSTVAAMAAAMSPGRGTRQLPPEFTSVSGTQPGSHDLPPELMSVFDAQLGSRHLDLAARRLGALGQGFYSIGSSGHESNAALAAALRPTDPALLHYRSGAFYLHRASQVPGTNPLLDVMLGVTASRDEPIAGGRHKVFGHHDLSIIPLTSTIASHLPRALGLAFGIGRAERLSIGQPWPADSVVVCGFGDASANHSTAVGAINAARHCAHQRLPLPLLFVCEDNGIGISVRTPSDWISSVYSTQLPYFFADGTDTPRCWRPRPRRSTGCVRTVRPPSCTCGPSA